MRPLQHARTLRATATLALAALAACATTTQATWGERENHAPGPSVEVAAPPSTKMTADDLARSLGSVDRCLALAQEHDQQSQRKGWILLQACARRPDFVELDEALRAPWLKRVQGTPEGPRLLTHVIAHRGGRVGLDLERVQARKVPLLGLEQALGKVAAPEGSAVLLRGRIVQLQDGKADWQLAIDEEDYVSDLAAPAADEAGESARADEDGDDDGDDLGGTLEASEQDDDAPSAPREDELVLRRSGRRVLVKAGALEPGVKAGLACVALIRFAGPQDCAGPKDKAITTCAGGTLVELLTTSGD